MLDRNRAGFGRSARSRQQIFEMPLLLSHAFQMLIMARAERGKKARSLAALLWDLRREAADRCVELQRPDSSDEDWEQARGWRQRLRRKAGSPTVMMLDDIHENQVLVQAASQ